MAATAPDLTYDQRLGADWDYAMSEIDRLDRGETDVHRALEAIASRLNDLGIDYSVVGGMALFAHGYRRLTTDVDILIDPDSLPKIHAALDGLGYLPLFAGSKNLKDTVRGVPIEFLLAGGYPGDGKEKPVAFPSPAEASVEINGIRFLSLEKLVELKLASAMSNELRAKDLGDVIELIRVRRLAADFGDRLDPFVRDRFVELVGKIEADGE